MASQLSMVGINRNHFAQSFSSCGRKSCCGTWEMDELPALNCIASCFEKNMIARYMKRYRLAKSQYFSIFFNDLWIWKVYISTLNGVTCSSVRRVASIHSVAHSLQRGLQKPPMAEINRTRVRLECQTTNRYICKMTMHFVLLREV